MPTTYYSCTTIGCSATTQVTSFSTLQACETGCVGWGCNLNVLSEDTNIYVFYDTSSMDSSWLENAYQAVTSWVATGIPGHTGTIYHTLDHRERWLQYDHIIYSGNVGGNVPLWSGGQPNSDFQGLLNSSNALRAEAWKQREVNNGNVWYDMFKIGNTVAVPNTGAYPTYGGDVIDSSGLPPQSTHSDNVLVITFNDEAFPDYHSNDGKWTGQPTSDWISDYDNYTGATWDGIQAAGGTINQFLYVATSGTSVVEPTICSVSTPCLSGPAFAQWFTSNGSQPGAAPLGQPLVYDNPATIGGFTNSNGAFVQGCTGIWSGTTNNPNPCPESWWNSGTIGGLFVGPPGTMGLSNSYNNDAKNHALQAVAAISSGNKTSLNGTWQIGTAPILDTNPLYAPTSNLSNIVNMGYGLVYDANVPNLENENPYWVDSSGNMINLVSTPNPVGPVPNHGGLDQYGWGVNVEATLFTPTNLASAINSFLAQGSTAQTFCTSAATSLSPQYPYSTELECQTLDGCGNYICSTDGCIPWGDGPFNSLSSCTASCYSYECRASGCTAVAGSAATYYVSGNTAQDSLTACTASCISYNCSSTGCTELVGSGGTFQTNQSCTASCVSYACADSGCTTFPGSGNTPYSASTACTTNCVSWNCTPTGCVERAGTGGTYTLLAHCTTACTSYYCTHSGCTEQVGTGGTFSSSASCTASCTSYLCSDTGCTQQVGSGGTYFNSGSTQESYTACTASCVSYSCTTTGCSQQAGSGGTYWNSVNPATALANCNTNCTSYNCSPTGCVVQAGTGGHYPNYNACSAACYSYNCSSSGCSITGGTGGTYASAILCEATCKSWNCESGGCIEYPGTGGTHTIYTNCTSGCSSYECRATGCTQITGTGGTDYSACTGTCSSYTCTDTGCTIQQGSGGTYYNTDSVQDALTACTASCLSWNCTNTGCVVRSGTSGTFSSLVDCQTGCTSYECRASGCTQIIGSGASPSLLACESTCSSWNCSPTGCTELVGSGGTFQTLNNCQNDCKSWNCTDIGCTQIAGSGGTFSSDSDCATACTSYHCTINGCVFQGGTGGTFSDLNDCSSACTSFECRDSGCTEVVGTGSTNALSACTAQCQSYNCSDTGCIAVTGSGGTFYNPTSLQDSLTACTASCASFFCTPTGCTEQAGTGGTYSALTSCTASCSSWNCSPTGCTQLNGTGGTFTREIDCTTGCTSYNCTDSGCVERIGTGGTYTTSAACTASCVSYGCSDSGCAQQIGSGATHFNSGNTQDALTACTASCVSWNCTDTGCTEIVGTGGTYSALTYCQTGTTWGQLPCTSWFCTVTGCTEQQGSGGTYANSGLCATDGACVSYYCVDTGCTQVVGTGGTVNSSGTCTASCTSWNCTSSGCTEIQGTGGTYTTQAHCTTACTSFFCTDSGCTEQIGTGGTFSTSASCTASCSSFYCTPVGCTEQQGTGGTYSTSATCTAQCQSYNCSDNGCVIQNGTGGTYYNSSSLQDSLTACTAACYSYQCSDSGCNKVTGSGGTHYNISYPWHAQTACTASCVSWACGPTGVISGPNNSACIEQVGTGSTWTIEQDCVTNCQSWNCGDSGCEFAAGSGGTWYYLNDPTLAQTNCSTHCWSYWCDTIGCQDETGSGQTFYVANSADITFDNVLRAQTACTEDCQSWSCTTQSGLVGPTGQPTGCLQIPGTGATNTDINFNGCYTACTSYDCGPQGCYLAVGGQGQYTDILTCENACMSWQCTDTGCELLEGNTGTTTQPPCESACTSYDCTDTGCVQRPGLGGQHLTIQSCSASCKSWFCDNTSCTEQQGSGATFSSLNSCTNDCQSWNCDSYGCSQQVGTGATHATSAICSTACTSFECNPFTAPLGCYELSGTGWTFSSLVDCTGSCTSYSCEEYPIGCIPQAGLTGFPQAVCSTCVVYFCGGLDGPLNEKGCYAVPGNPAIPSSNYQFSTLIQCEDACTSWDCTSTGCTQYPETGHTFTSDLDCAFACQSWDCQAPNQPYGCTQLPYTGGTYTSQTECDCYTYDCGSTGCVTINGIGGAYTALTECEDVCISYNCTDTGCIVLPGNSGTFQDPTTCSGNCISYNCTDTGCVQHTGTGGTFVDLSTCLTGCTSWNCTDKGCEEIQGSGGTWATQAQCTPTCISWECTPGGVVKNPGTASTYTSYAQATGMCISYACYSTYLGDPIDGCGLYSPAPSWWTNDYGYWGSGGAHDSMSACTANCINWGCNHIAITQFAKVYVYYDITSMGATVLEEAYDRVTDWISSIPGWSGNTYHILTQSQERWLTLPVITFSGRSFDYRSNHNIPPNCDPLRPVFSEFPFGSFANNKVSKSLTWAANTQAGLDGNFYDTGISGSCSPPQTFTYSSGYLNGATFTNHISCYQGPPPTASTNEDVINIVFLDEANFAYHSYHQTYGSGNPTFWPCVGAGCQWNYVPNSTACLKMNRAPQPTESFRYDYERYIEAWNIVTGTTSGSVRNYFYPRPASTYIRSYNKQLALNAFASISSGNQAVPDGTWTPGTAPNNSATALANGQGPNTPYYCKTNLSLLESMNPYTINYTGQHYDYDDLSCTGNTIHWSSDTMTGGVGHLDRFGWGINISLDTFYTQTFYDDMNAFLTASTAGNFVIGCVSAATQQTLQYPYASASGCSDGCSGLSCSDYGCVLGSVDQFTSSVVCSAACQSYNCTPTGCVWQYGTGGTYYNATDGTFGLADCQIACQSYNCVDPITLTSPTDQGCEMIIGTGGTFTTYSACTATCQSWNCECSCDVYPSLTACTTIPNTGGTYSALTSCTATCSTGTSWYCSAATYNTPFYPHFTPCYVFCGNGGYYDDGVTPIPMSLVFGPFSTSGQAYSNCCGPALTWDCTGTSVVNSCSSLTALPGQYITAGDAMDWLTLYLVPQGVTGFTYESTTPSYGTTPNECAGPNGGIMHELSGIAHPSIGGGAYYHQWFDFVAACIGAGIAGIVQGMTYHTVNALLFVYTADYITIFTEPCFCEDATCGCAEIQGGGGQYSALTSCTATCCTADTSFNCIHDQYKPICNTKPSIGVVATASVVLDHFRQFDPTGIFALSKFYPYFNTVGAPANVPWSTAYANTIGQGQSTYMDCYKKVPTIGNPGLATFIPTTYMESISHSMISGGTPFYTYQTFLDAVVAAGVVGVTLATHSTILCSQINAQLSPWFGGFGCNIITKPCCSSEDCYCYELFTTGGTFTTLPDCTSVCCPINTGYTCDQVSTCIGPIPFASVYTNWFAGPSAQSNCLSFCTGTTTWDCVPASITGTCDDAQYGEFPPTSVAFQTSTILYPFGSASITNTFGLLGTAEKVLTDNTYMNPNWAFSSVTWELGAPQVGPLPTNICIGPNGKPVYRIMAIGSSSVDNGTMYPSWGTFISAAQTQGFGVSTSQNASVLEATGLFKFSVKTQPCICNDAPCHCVEILGNTGTFGTSALCMNVCCTQDSWDCTINGCEDPGNGTGAYTVLLDCEHDCKEWLCGAAIPPNHVDGKIVSGIVGTAIDQAIYLVSNVATSTPFSDYMYEDQNYPTGLPCAGNSGYPFRFVDGIIVPQSIPSQSIVTPLLTSWDSFITYLNTTYPILAVTTSMSFTTVDSIILANNNNIGIKVSSSDCVCQTLPCDCHTVPGTGHTNGYHITQYTTCEQICCSGVCVDDCGVLLVGRQHGVSVYDPGTNVATQLFHPTGQGFEIADIAAGHDLIWLVNEDTLEIEEHRVLDYCPFQSVFNRTIETGVGLGKGLAPTGSPIKLIANAFGKILLLDISVTPIPAGAITVLFTLPQYAGGPISSPFALNTGNPVLGQQMEVTGDIMYDSNSNKMLILYGIGSYVDMWIGEFDMAGNQLQAFHIMAGVNPYDYFTGLFEDVSTGRKYAVTRDGMVSEVKVSPTLTIMPSTQTIADYYAPSGSLLNVVVNGGSNTVNALQDCISLMSPISYNCLQSGGGCTDPLDGTGKYSVFNGEKSSEEALASCKSACVSNTWNCNSTKQETDAPLGTGYELPITVTNDLTAYDYVAQTPSLQNVKLTEIYFQNEGVTTVSSSLTNTDLENQPCWPTYLNGWKYSLDTITIIPSDITVSTWSGLITNLLAAGVKGINTSSTRHDVYEASKTFFGVSIPFTQNSKARTCFGATCDCVEVIGSGGFYSTSGGCIDACCPTYNCTLDGCIDPKDGSGSYKGTDGLTKCKKECKELLCVTAQPVTDSCIGKIVPTWDYSPHTESSWRVLSHFADPNNKLQETNFVKYKWIQEYPIGTSLPGHCDNSMLEHPVGLESFWVHYTNLFNWSKESPEGSGIFIKQDSFNADNWIDIITYAQDNGCSSVKASMTYSQVERELIDVCGYTFASTQDYCRCSYTSCGCQEVIGTGHTGAYPVGNEDTCESNCCPNVIVINGARMGIIDELEKVIYESKEQITTNVDLAVEKLRKLKEEGKTGDDCQYCKDNNGVCLYNGCISYKKGGIDDELVWEFHPPLGPLGPSYNCYSTGCFLVWHGGWGQFNGANALNNCKDSCVSYNCKPGIIDDDCEEMIKLNVIGDASKALSIIADKNNGYQEEKFDKFKYEEIVSEKPDNACITPGGNVWSKISTIKATDWNGERTIVNNTSTWSTFISELSKTGYQVTDTMSYDKVVQQGELAQEKFKISVNESYCKCSGQPCSCTMIVGTGGTGTYPTLSLCNQAASSNPCCVTDINSYNCTINGCQKHLTGVGLGTYSSAYALWECQQDCIAWGCQDMQLTLTTATTVVTPQTTTAITVTTGMSSADTIIHVWYDTSSMSTTLLNTAQSAINQWVVQEQLPGGVLDGWQGLLHHSFSSAEDWIKWPAYSINQWGGSPSNYVNAPNKNLLVICLIDEANNVHPQTYSNAYTPGTGQGKGPDTYGVWGSNKGYFTSRYNDWVAAGGSIQTLVYAASNGWGAGNTGNHRRDFIRHLFAAINGNNLHHTNGTWTIDPNTGNPNTINGNQIFGGPTQTSLYGTNDFIDLSWATTTQNGYNNDVPLTSYGVYGVYNRRGTGAFNVTTLGADITQFITTHPITTTSYVTSTYNITTIVQTSSVYTITGQCVSAQTIINTSYPFSTQPQCEIADCHYEGWNCGINGCYSQTNGQYLTFKECDKECLSYSCQTEVTGLIQEGTLISGSYCREFYNGSGTTIPLTGNGYDALSYYMDSVASGFNYGGLQDGYGDVNWFVGLFDNTGNNTGGIQTTVYTPVITGPNNTTGTTGLIVEDDGQGNCETPSGGRLSRIDRVQLIDTTTGVVIYDSHSHSLEHFLEVISVSPNIAQPQMIPGFPSGIPGISQGMSLYNLLQVSMFNAVRQFNIKIYVVGCPCTHDCDCRTLVGTGQTGTYYYPGNWSGAYHDCVDNCCASLKTWTCPTNPSTAAQTGCIDPLDGSGAYSTKALCDSDCNVTWDCAPASNVNGCPSVIEYVPYTLTQAYFTNQDPGYLMSNAVSSTPLATTYGPGGVNSDIEALIYIFDEHNGLYDTPFNKIGFARGQTYLTPLQQCDYPNSGGRKLGSIEYIEQKQLSAYYCMEYEMRVNGVPFMPWSTTASTDSAFYRCTDSTDVNYNPIADKKYYSVRDVLDVIEWMYSQPETTVFGQLLEAGPCNGNAKGFYHLFNSGPNTATCNNSKPAASNGFKPNLTFRDLWAVKLFRPYNGYAITATSPVNNWNASWGTGVNAQGANIQHGHNQVPIAYGRNLIISNQSSTMNSTECQCLTSCKCNPVMGISGFYTTEMTCLSHCCPDDVCTICCRDISGINFTVVQLATNCTCPPNSYLVLCNEVPMEASCKLGQTWDAELKQCIADTSLPCMTQHCVSGYKWDELRCECVVCPVEECSEDKIWNSTTCQCETVALPCPVEECGTNYVWDTVDCVCKCITQSCTDGYTWNSTTCQCEAVPGEVVYGCTDPAATNYNSLANTSDGSCTYPSDEEDSERAENLPHISGLILNPLTHEYARGCVTSDVEVIETYSSHSNLKDCLNSGIAGTWKLGESARDIDSRETFGIRGSSEYTQIPMCCESWIIETTREGSTLDYRVCDDWCISQDTKHGGNYLPLYNVVGPNTVDEESELVFYDNSKFINYVHYGDIVIDSNFEHSDLPMLYVS